ncbi:MAG: Gfo/Idh/MocA family oxidoreductase [Balneolaceae bacterium]
MSNKIRIGIIGFGGFGNFIYDALSHSEFFEVICVADKFKNSAEIPGDITFLKNWNDLLQLEEVDAVIISTPPVSHAEITLASLKAGKHVLTEKPLAISAKLCKEIKKAASEFNGIVMVDFLQRFNPLLEILHAFHSENLFGSLERFYVENYAQDETLPPSHWFWDKKVSGGILIEHAVHFIDIVHWFQAGEIEHISGFSDQRNTTQTDRMSATVQYKNGLLASHYHSFTRPDIFERTNMRFVFNTAQFELDGWIPESGNFIILGNKMIEEELQKLPNIRFTARKPVNAKKVRGELFDYTHLIEGSFASSQSKKELYALALQKILQDFYQKVKDQNHQTRVTLDDAIKAVYVAEEATQNSSS